MTNNELNLQEIYDIFLLNIKYNSYICSQCGKIIFPTITAIKNNFPVFTNSCHSIYGRKNNKLILNKICDKCNNKLKK